MGDENQNTQLEHSETTDVSRRDFLLNAASISVVGALPLLPITALAKSKGDKLQKVLDDSVAANRFPFVVGMTAKASGVTFAAPPEKQHLARVLHLILCSVFSLRPRQ